MQNYLSVCAIFKNEAENLEEWLRFYEFVGAEHFYLYDNCSSDAAADVLRPWLDAGKVTLYRTHPGKVQMACYRHCFQNFRYDNVWIAFLDLDEFFFSPQQPDLRVFLRPYEKEVGVVANWVMFGAAGHQERPSGLATLNYTRRCQLDLCTFERHLLRQQGLDAENPGSYYPICSHVKSIVKAQDVLDCTWSPHFFTYRDQRLAVTAWGLPVPGPWADEVAIDALRVNHYFSRSWSEFRRKIQRGRADSIVAYDIERMIETNKSFDLVEDMTIFPLAHRLQAAMPFS